MTLRSRFTAIFVAFAAAVTALGGWGAWQAASRALEAELDEKLVWVAGAWASQAIRAEEVLFFEAGDEGTEEWVLYQNRLRLLKTEYVDLAHVFSLEEGTTVARALVTDAPADSIGAGQRLFWLEPYGTELARAREVGSATTRLFRGNDGRYYKFGFVRLEASDAFLGVQIRADYMAPLGRLSRRIVLGSVIAAVLAALLGWGMATNVAAPLERLSRAALGIQRGRMDRPISVERGDELGRLARAMERMRTGIQERDERLRLMLSQVAHEIRNPLGGLELFASAAKETDEKGERNRILDRMRQEVTGLNDIIDEFLMYARPHQTEALLHDVRDPVLAAADLARAEVEKEGGALHLALPEKPLLAIADPFQVKRLMLNLLRNAAQAGTHVWVDGEMVNGEVRLSVKDDGPGVSKDLRDRIFEPFVTDKERGAGLGLAIVKGIAKANRGRVHLVPEPEKPGVGAEFRVYFRGPEDLPVDGALLASGERVTDGRAE